VQPFERQSTSPRKCVQQEWSSTGKTADAVGPLAVDDPLLLPERDVHAEIGIDLSVSSRSKHTVTSKRRVCQNLTRVITLERTPW